ncbi:MAG TPA: type I restriction-modification system subunit M N-terminal domain-containing protein [Acidithiobacillus sp.]|nr:type I restriction-modification system subunit M N-terminal domain-containing protein [Acidithiobacillus sp.]
MPLKKSELYAPLWKSCDELRGGMDASQYKDYVLVLLFVKYVSDKAERDPDSLLEVPYGGSFSTRSMISTAVLMMVFPRPKMAITPFCCTSSSP